LLLAAPETLPRAENVVVDPLVSLFALALSLLVGLGMSLLPALHVLRTDPAAHLQGGGSKGVAASRHRSLTVLVASEVALAFLLVFASGLLLRTFDRLQRVPLGFDPERVLSASLVLPESRYADQAAMTAVFRRLVESVDALPGVEVAATVIGSPLQPGAGIGGAVAVFGRAPEPEGRRRGARIRPVQGDYFGAVRLPILHGRGLAPSDDERAARVAVVNQTFARDFFPGQSPIGHQIAIPDHVSKPGDPPAWMTIVGICADVKSYRLDEPDSRTVYLPYSQRTAPWYRFGDLVVRTKGDPALLVASIRQAVLAVDKALPLAEVTTLEARYAEAGALPRFNALALGAFAFLAVFLALQGLFALLAFVVEERRREIGLRMALGARARDVQKLVAGMGLSLVLSGLAAGVFMALGLGRMLASILYEVRPSDPGTLLMAALGLLITALLAAGIPAWRASKTDPMRALRSE
jgi:putative ABC transport system permease protein